MPHKNALVPLPIVLAVTVTGVAGNAVIAPILPDIVSTLNATSATAGLIFGAAAFPGIFLAPVSGVLADRYGRRAILIPCLFLFGGAAVGMALTKSVAVFVLFRFIQGIGMTAPVNLAIAMVGDYPEGRQRSKALGRNSVAIALAAAALPALSGGIAVVAGWRWSLGLYALTLLLIPLVAEGVPVTSRLPFSGGEQIRSVAKLVTGIWPVVTMLGWLCLSWVIHGIVFTVIPLYLEVAFGLTAGARGAVIASRAIPSSLAAAFSWRVSENRGPLGGPMLACYSFALGLLIMAWSGSLMFVFIGVLLIGLGEGLMVPGLQQMAIAGAPAIAVTSVLAVETGVLRLGQTVAPVLTAVAWGRIGGTGTFLLGSAAAALTLLGLRYARRHQPPPLDRHTQRPPLT